jgi:hypothetical protein
MRIILNTTLALAFLMLGACNQTKQTENNTKIEEELRL